MIHEGVKYLTFRNLDLEGSATANQPGGSDHNGLVFEHGTGTPVSYVWIEGGTCSNWNYCWLTNPWTNDSGPPRHLSLGACGRVWTIRNTSSSGGYGFMQDSVLAMDMANTGTDGVFDHNIYFTSGPRPSDVLSGNVIECSHFTDSSLDAAGVSVGLHLKISGRHDGVVVRNNVFDDDHCGTFAIGIGTSNAGLPSEWAKPQIYGNVFRTDCVVNIYSEDSESPQIYNNVFWARHHTGTNQGEMITLGAESFSRPGLVGNARIFNNTFYCDQADCPERWVTLDDKQGSTNQLFNNLFFATLPVQTLVNAACDRFGEVGGPDIDNNYIYTPADSDPGFPACAAGSGNSTAPFSLDPLLKAPATGDFSVTSSSVVVGLGRATGAPATDFTGSPRPPAPSIGAFDLSAPGGVPPLTPVLLP